MMLTPEKAQHLFEYKDGQLFWKCHVKSTFVGARAGYENGNGYRKVSVDGKLHFEHRIVFLMHHGWVPTRIDHIDNNRGNNRIENLRSATATQNAWNIGKVRSQTGRKNVYIDERTGKYCVNIKIAGKSRRFGSYETLDHASLVASAARERHHGEYANHGVQ